ncbi:MAG: GNAT family N-acetyltransferase [Candidatus Omnitrophica bacterium]|nr:GNAT family N-acetyltransferase [Candidatus Omnitrophota bacterium]
MKLHVTEYGRIPEEKPWSVWEQVLDGRVRYSVFQTPLWSNVLDLTIPGARPCHYWLRFSDESEAVLPLFSCKKKFGLSKLESLPWGTYGDLIGNKEITLDHRIAAASKIVSLFKPLCEITVSPTNMNTIPTINMEIKEPHIQECTTHILALGDSFEEIWMNQFQARNRTAIRRARDKGVIVTWGNDAECAAALQYLYKNATQRWEGVETLPAKFFEHIGDMPEDQVRIWLARYEERILAADVILYGREEVQYFAGAGDPEFSEYNASKLMMAEIIRDACERGFKVFNFGSSGGLKGVERFKHIFGGQTQKYARLRFTSPWLSKIQTILD